MQSGDMCICVRMCGSCRVYKVMCLSQSKVPSITASSHVVLHDLHHALAHAFKDLFLRISNLLHNVQHKVVVQLEVASLGQYHPCPQSSKMMYLSLMNNQLASIGEGFPTFGGSLCLCPASQST